MVRRGKRLAPSCTFLRNRNLPKHHTRDEPGQLLLLQGEKSWGLQHTMVGPGGSVLWTRHQERAASCSKPFPPLSCLTPCKAVPSPKPSGTWMGCIGQLVDLFPKRYSLLQSHRSYLKIKLKSVE